MNIFKKIIFGVALIFHRIMFNISVALYSTEIELLKADPNNLSEKDKKNLRKIHHNPILEKFYAGQRDEKFVKDYYELLKKADKFINSASEFKMAATADKYHMNYGHEDEHGRKHEHYSFFDPKHKNRGKTLNEVFEKEMRERRTDDDEYELVYIFNNQPLEAGLVKITDIVEKIDEDNDKYNLIDITRKSKQFIFPIKIDRENDEIVNKIEQLTEYLHVKKIGFEYRQLEFFIPLKFRTSDIKDNSEIFNELINIKNVYIKGKYGRLFGFNVRDFKKRMIFKDAYEVWKFTGIEMEIINY